MTRTHTSSCVLEICLMMTHTPMPIPTFDCVAQHLFLFYVYRSVSLTRMRRYTQLAYLFNQYATSLLSRDSRIADCTVRHPGVERPFSSLYQFHTFTSSVNQVNIAIFLHERDCRKGLRTALGTCGRSVTVETLLGSY